MVRNDRSITCCSGYFDILAPFLAEDSEPQSSSEWFTKTRLTRIALWSSVMLVSLYLMLTLVILLESVDTVNFDAHELYGAPFLLGFAGAMVFTHVANLT